MPRSEIEPRYLGAADVAAYLGISRSMVDQLVRQGRLPLPIELTPRLKRWDREAIDAALAGPPTAMRPCRSIDDVVKGIADGIATGHPARPHASRRRRGLR